MTKQYSLDELIDFAQKELEGFEHLMKIFPNDTEEDKIWHQKHVDYYTQIKEQLFRLKQLEK